MAKGSGYVKYAKQRDAGPGQDDWARLKDWKDPGRSKSGTILTGDTGLRNSQTGRFKSAGQSEGYGSSSVDGARDRTYGSLNKPSDSTA